ncbi:MAG: NADH-quinone oxidoreductase subunit J [Legionellaceae bacterium]
MQLSLVQAIFYIFSGLTVLSATMVVFQKNPVRCVLFLVLAFFSSAVLWMLAEAEFLALILVLVYVGAVMTLFLFVVMMLNIDTETTKSKIYHYLPFGLIIVAFFVGLVLKALPVGGMVPVAVDQTLPELSNTVQLGMVLYTDYVFAFEIAAILLLVAIVAAITLTHRALSQAKRQNVVHQMMTQPEDRLKLVQMTAEQ